ncbi:WD repeat-containing protein 43-like [Lolium rigidum]|uniref:WD repeat-containing protein 43-like n=1 Tax=Lolium rigidum TaxID=89674 RepID=UPI001F5C5F6B|nr:WD repeat-containing protein 43-like [Lolium rigidum]
MAPAPATIRDLLTSFSPASDFLALSSGDGRIKVWDAARGHLQTEFADIPAVEAGALAEAKRGHLALDYTCMKWVQLSSKKKRKAGSSLLVLGTGSGDVLALDVAAGQWKWRISDCHPGGVTAVAHSRQGRTVYTAGADGMVCKIDPSDGSVAGKFKSSSKAISALAVSSDGKVLATAAGQLRTFDASDNKKIQKFSGHPVAVKTMIFSDNGEYVLSSGVGERYVAIWRLGGGKTQSSSCILSMEHPAIFVDCKCSGINANNGEIHVLAISEVGICYFWSGNSMDDLRNKKPTKIALSESSLSRTKQDFTIFAAKLQGIDGPNSTHVLLAYGSVVKPSFDKLLVCYGKDINLGVSEDGVLLPTIQPTMAQKGQYAKTKGTITALDRANAEDAILPLPKLHTQEKKRKHGVTKPSGDKLAIDSDLGTTTRLTEKRVPVQRIEDDSICIEDMLRECGVIDQSIEPDPDMATKILSDLFGRSGIPIDANLPSKKIRAHVRSLKPGDACKLLENLVSAWKSRSGSAELVLRWIYCLLVIHGRFISSEKPKKLISNLEKMCAERYAATEDLLKLSGRLRLIIAQVDKDAKDLSVKTQDSVSTLSDEEEEEIDELVYGEDWENSDDDAE